LRTVTAPAQSKIYTVINATTGGFSVKLVGAGPTTGVTIVAGESAVCAWNGSDFVKVSNTGGIASFTNVTVTGTTTLSGLTASTALALDASKNVVSVTNTGTGNNVLSASPTLTGTIGAASLTLSTDLTLSGGTANGVAYLNGSKVVTSGSTFQFDGSGKLALGNVAHTSFIPTTSLTLGNSSANAEIRMGQVDTSALISKWVYNATVGNAYGAIETYGQSNYIQFGASDFRWQIALSEQMRLTSTGLGIGTSSPAYKLDINTVGGSQATARLYGNDQSNVRLRLENAGSGGRTWEIVGGLPGANNANFSIRDVTGSTTPLIIDTSGNLGLGVTPSAWSAYKAFQMQAGSLITFSTNDWRMVQNVVRTGTTLDYLNNGLAHMYLQDGSSGGHVWYNAPSGTAGNAISFTQAMTLDASGNLLVGTTSAGYSASGRGLIEINGTSALLGFKTGNTNRGYLYTQGTDMIAWAETGAFTIGTAGASPIIFTTNNTERARIDSSGNFMVGTTTPTANCKLTVTGAGISIAGGRGSTFALAYPDWSIYNTSSGNALAFDNGSERVRIDSSGRLLVGTTTTSFGSRITSFNDSSYTFESQRTTTASEGHIAFSNANGAVGTIFTSGTTTSYNTSSDYRLKNITGPITNSGAYIDSLNPVEGTWKADGSTFVGLIAHEAQEASRTVVATGVKDGEEMQGMDYSSAEIIANLIAEIQSLRKRLADAGI
jgi:hypothetical protein